MKLRLSKIFNLNDPGWGRGGGSNDQEPRGSDERPPSRPHRRPPNNQGGNPPDLDQVIADLSKRLKSVFGGKGGGGRPDRAQGGAPSLDQADAAIAAVEQLVAATA